MNAYKIKFKKYPEYSGSMTFIGPDLRAAMNSFFDRWFDGADPETISPENHPDVTGIDTLYDVVLLEFGKRPTE